MTTAVLLSVVVVASVAPSGSSSGAVAIAEGALLAHSGGAGEDAAIDA
jgi:hypothetical protein